MFRPGSNVGWQSDFRPRSSGSGGLPSEPSYGGVKPGDLSGLVAFWNDFTDLYTDTAMTSPVTAQDDLVAARQDLVGGNTNNALQATSGLRPKVNVVTNGGKQWIECLYDGSDDQHDQGGSSGHFNFDDSDAWTFFCILRPAAILLSLENEIFNKNDGSLVGYRIGLQTTGSLIMSLYVGGVDAIQVVGSTTLSGGTIYTAVFRYDGSGLASGMQVFLNDVAETMTPLAPGPILGSVLNSGDLLIGNGPTGLGPFDGGIAVAGCYNRALSDVECGNIADYLNNICGAY